MRGAGAAATRCGKEARAGPAPWMPPRPRAARVPRRHRRAQAYGGASGVRRPSHARPPSSPGVHMSATPLFHLAFPVRDLDEARAFYGGLLGCPEGRSAEDWCDFDFWGHQIVAYRAPHLCGLADTSPVDGDDVPVRHFGAILPMADWRRWPSACARPACASSSSRRCASSARWASSTRCSSSIPRATHSNSRRSATSRPCSPASRNPRGAMAARGPRPATPRADRPRGAGPGLDRPARTRPDPVGRSARHAWTAPGGSLIMRRVRVPRPCRRWYPSEAPDLAGARPADQGASQEVPS